MGRRLALAAIVVAATTAVAAPATAASGTIDHVEAKDGQVRVLYSLSDTETARPDLGSLEVSLDGKPLDAKATLASDATQRVRRTAVLAVDVSSSMRADGKFAAAKRAARLFLDTAPKDVYVGIVTFASKVSVAQQPTQDRAASSAVLDDLQLSRQTRLYEGLTRAVATAGQDGARNVIVLSDGRDTSGGKLSAVTRAVKKSDVNVDVVALDQSPAEEGRLAPLADAGDGSVIRAQSSAALAKVFEAEAQGLASQIQITAPVPAGHDEGSLSVAVSAGGTTYTSTAFVRLAASSTQQAGTGSHSDATALEAAPAAPFTITPTMMLGGVGAIGVAALLFVLSLFGGRGRRKESLESRISAYTVKGVPQHRGAAPPQGVAAQAVDLASMALASNKGLEITLGKKLEAAGLAFRPAEWLLLHAAVSFGAAAVMFLVGGGSLLFAFGGLVLGAVVTWVFLGRKQARRLKAFNAQLAGTLQLMAGSLQAGLSFAQGLDTIVREGAEPVAGEFRRALVETRLGVTIEDALDGVSERMMSDDFRWTVMAIRIQREVGGNLAELMLSVAATLRERDYLRRQVKSLSAEGRFSAYILLALPPLVMLYEWTTNRSYLLPLFTTGLGYVLLGAMAAMMGIGGWMMKRMIKLEV